jgi:AhpC/TSA family
MKLVIRAAMLGSFIVGGVHAGEMRDIHGRVIDESGMPVAGADVSFYWTANGPLKDRNGKPYDFESVEGRKVLSANLGKMFPLGDVERPTRTRPDGRFSISVPGDRHHLLAMDHRRKRGGLAILAKGMGTNDVVIRLGPLVRVRGSIEGPGAGEHPAWANVLTMLPDDPTRPLDLTILAISESIDGRFEMSLPPGHYVLHTYTMRGDGAEIAEVISDREIPPKGEISEIDLGVLRLSPFKPLIQGRRERAKAAGTWGDYTKHFGEKPPQWHILDARGVPKDAQISDFKGKWLLVYFWGLSCSPCLKHGIPNLIKFYEEHQPQRDRFEILSLCIAVEGELRSVADLDKRLQSIVKHVWGKPQPFPVLLDPSFTTWERFGLPGLGTVILIDPEGKLMKGDESVLAEKLKERAARPR